MAVCIYIEELQIALDEHAHAAAGLGGDCIEIEARILAAFDALALALDAIIAREEEGK